MDALLLGRWQFGITTVYHFVMVPLTIGLGVLVAVFQIMWWRTGDERYLRLVKFWGKLYLINFILGVATGLVQEFQFGMAWSEYARFVGDVFGAPLAMEGLLAFFVESTFLGLWIFGWKLLPRGLHTLSLCIAVTASIVSAFFIIVANSWMQHPVGAELVDGRAVLVDIWAVLTNNTALVAFAHTIAGSIAVGGAFLLGIAWYHLWQRRRDGIDTVDARGRVTVGDDPTIAGRDAKDHAVWLTSLRVGAAVAVVAFGAVAITGDLQAKLMFVQQPLKMAAAEGACHDGTGFSVLAVGDLGSRDCEDVVEVVTIPGMLSFLANGDFETPVKGVNTLVPEYQEAYGTHDAAGNPVEYVPIMEVTYWGFRLMIGFGIAAAGAAAAALWITRRGTVPASKRLMQLALVGIGAPFAANIAGWVFTEMGRQPFVVAPNPDPSGVDGVWLFTQSALSSTLTVPEVVTSLVAFTLVYGGLLVVELVLLTRYVRGGVAAAMPELAPAPHDSDDDGTGTTGGRRAADGDDDVLAFAY